MNERQYTAIHNENQLAVKTTQREFDEYLEPIGFTKVAAGDVPDGFVYTEDVPTAVACVENGVTAQDILDDEGDDDAGEQGVQSDAGDGDGGVASDDSSDAGVSPDEAGGDPEVESDEGTFDGRPDPNNYRNTDNQGFVNNRAAGGAVPGEQFSTDYVNGVDPEGEE